MLELILDTLKESIIITLLVSAMMAGVECVNKFTAGKIRSWLGRSRYSEVLLGDAFGVVPGCMGGYFTVSLFSEGSVSFAALLSMMIATTGDEAFLMLAQFPGTALCIFAGLFVLALASGIAYKFINKTPEVSHSSTASVDSKPLAQRLRHIFPHAVKVFVWTFCILLAVSVLQQNFDLESWIKGNGILMVIIAVLIGIIPQSGPHMAFVTLYASGVLPLPVLLANCIMQDGHAGLPLLAKSPKAFIATKSIKAVLAFTAGLIGLLLI